MAFEVWSDGLWGTLIKSDFRNIVTVYYKWEGKIVEKRILQYWFIARKQESSEFLWSSSRKLVTPGILLFPLHHFHRWNYLQILRKIGFQCTGCEKIWDLVYQLPLKMKFLVINIKMMKKAAGHHNMSMIFRKL